MSLRIPIYVVVLRILCGLGLGLAAAEGTGRLICPDGNWAPQGGVGARAFEPLPGGSYRTRGGLDVVAGYSGRPKWRVRTDALGRRIPGPGAVRTSPAEALETVFVLGASHDFGLEVLGEETWPYLLETDLRERGLPVRVENLSQPGYALPQMLGALESLADDQLPDRILMVVPTTGPYVLGFGEELDDIAQDAEFPYTAIMIPMVRAADRSPELEVAGGMLVSKERPGRGGLRDRLVLGSVLAHRIELRWETSRRRGEVHLRGPDEAPDPDRILTLARRLGERLKAQARRCRDHGTRLHLLVLPVDPFVVQKNFESIRQRALVELFTRSGLPERLLDRMDFGAETPFRMVFEHGHGGDFLEHDIHFSRRGHRKVADRVAAWYLQSFGPELRQRPRPR